MTCKSCIFWEPIVSGKFGICTNTTQIPKIPLTTEDEEFMEDSAFKVETNWKSALEKFVVGTLLTQHHGSCELHSRRFLEL